MEFSFNNPEFEDFFVSESKGSFFSITETSASKHSLAVIRRKSTMNACSARRHPGGLAIFPG